MSSFLDHDTYRGVVQSAPIVSIDLLVRDRRGRYLLGRRRNRPAQGAWFVPGGRVRKDETLDAAFLRLTHSELGHRVARAAAEFAGVYEHFYDDNFAGTDFSTHYIVLAHSLPELDLDELALPREQHGAYRFETREELLQDPEVHRYTKLYFG
jgi:colanic acid biosynthesis protein WcaH